MKKCAIFGHRECELDEMQFADLLTIFHNLIAEGVETFLFGSSSQFDDLCHMIVTTYQECEVPNIKRINYPCGNEAPILKTRKKRLERTIYDITGKHVDLKVFDEIVTYEYFDKAAYLQRNKKMVDDCDCCVVFYNKKYKPPKQSNTTLEYQPESGVQEIIKYIKRKKKKIYFFKI